MSKIHRLACQESLRSEEHSKSSTKAMVRTEQKSIIRMQDLVQKFLKPVKLGLGLLVGTLSAAKACLLIEKRSGFVEWGNGL